MSMSKKHFIALADAMRPVLNADGVNELTGVTSKANVIDALIRFCHEQNPNFMEGRWMDYLNGDCGPSGGQIKRRGA